MTTQTDLPTRDLYYLFYTPSPTLPFTPPLSAARGNAHLYLHARLTVFSYDHARG